MARSSPSSSHPVVKDENYISIYANSVEIAYTDGDFQFFMLDHTTDEDTNDHVIRRKARIVLSPENTRRFAHLLNNMLANWNYEKERAIEEAKAAQEAREARKL